MPQFDVYQSVGPQVDVRLFGDAASRGAALGQAIPNPVTSMIRGAQEGYKYGLDVQAQAQQNQQRQHQIDRQPQVDAAQDAATRNAEAIAQINAMKLEEARQTQELSIQDETALLKNRTAQNNQELALRQQLDAFTTAFGDAKTPQEQLAVLQSGKYGGVLKDPTLLTNSLKTVYTGLPEGSTEKQSVGELLKVKGAQDYYQELAQKNLPKYLEAQQELYSNPLTNAITKNGSLNVPIDQYPTAVDFLPSGMYEVNSANKMVRNEDGSPRVNPNASLDAESRDKFDVFSKDGTLLYSGKNDFAGITTKAKAAYDNYATQVDIQNGSQGRKAIRGLIGDQPQQGAGTGSPKQLPTFETPSQPQEPVTSTLSPGAQSNPIVASLQPKLDLGEDEVKAIEQPMEKLNRFAQVYAKSPAFRSSPQAVAQLSQLTTNTARGISDVRFDKDPTIQKQYDNEAVAEYNASLKSRLDREARNKFAFEDVFRNPFTAEVADTTAIFEAYRAKDSKDLYFINQRQGLEDSITKSMTEVLQQTQRKQETVANRQVSKNKNTAFLSQVSGGRGY